MVLAQVRQLTCESASCLASLWPSEAIIRPILTYPPPKKKQKNNSLFLLTANNETRGIFVPVRVFLQNLQHFEGWTSISDEEDPFFVGVQEGVPRECHKFFYDYADNSSKKSENDFS